jgi:hypothetical protein
MSSPTPNSCSTADFTVFPTADIACAIGSTSGVPSNTSSVFQQCCKSASVEPFNGDCGYYCLSIDQSVAELQACFQEKGARPADIFCNGNQTSKATGTGKPSSASQTGSAGARPSTGAAARVGGNVGVSKMGLSVVGMFVASVLAGMMV